MKARLGKSARVSPGQFLVLVITMAVIAGLSFLAFRYTQSRAVDKRIAELAPGGAPPETIEGLREAISIYEGKIAENVKSAAQAGIYWKLLANRYIERGMYGEALGSLRRAIEYFPEDSSLHYLTGLSAATMAKSTHDYELRGTNKERERLLALAEDSHKRAIGLDAKNSRALYALSVLYVFELNRSKDAIPLLERFIELQSRDVDAMFVLARAYYVENRRDDAVALYDRIIETARDAGKKKEAESNKMKVLDELYAAR
jgi:cytochrome c-type biogenesis protein CcmH/NrfG